MDSVWITATAAGLGSLLGAGASITTTWLSQRTQNLRTYAEWKQRGREALFKEFINEASRVAIDALSHSMERPELLIKLYGILSCIRLMSGQEVVRQGEACCRRIVEQYGRPNLTTDEIRAAIAEDRLGQLDLVKEFSKACRDELLGAMK